MKKTIAKYLRRIADRLSPQAVHSTNYAGSAFVGDYNNYNKAKSQAILKAVASLENHRDDVIEYLHSKRGGGTTITAVINISNYVSE